MAESSTPSAMSRPSTWRPVKPMARNTAISVARSRMVMAMVLAVTIRMAASTAAVMVWIMVP